MENTEKEELNKLRKAIKIINSVASDRFREDPGCLYYSKDELRVVVQKRYGDLMFLRDFTEKILNGDFSGIDF